MPQAAATPPGASTPVAANEVPGAAATPANGALGAGADSQPGAGAVSLCAFARTQICDYGSYYDSQVVTYPRDTSR